MLISQLKKLDFNKLIQKEAERYRQLFPNNPHLKRERPEENLVLVVGNKDKSRLLEKAILISQRKPYKIGPKENYYAVSEEMRKLLGVRGFIQTSLPRLITDGENINNLKCLLGIDQSSFSYKFKTLR